jgi:hypothetical protein
MLGCVRIFQPAYGYEEQFFRLLREQAWSTEPPADGFSTVLSFIWTLPTDEAIRVLRHQVSWARNYAASLRSSAREFDVATRSRTRRGLRRGGLGCR